MALITTFQPFKKVGPKSPTTFLGQINLGFFGPKRLWVGVGPKGCGWVLAQKVVVLKDCYII